MRGTIPTSTSVWKFADLLAIIGAVLGMCFIAFFPIAFVIWIVTFFIHRSLVNQAAILSKLETIEDLLTKTQSEQAAVPASEAIQES